MIHIYTIGCVISVFMFLYTYLREQSSYALKVAGLFILFLALPMTIKLIELQTGYASRLLFAFIHSTPFTYGPFLYIYTCLIIEDKESLNSIKFIHFLPFLLVTILILAGMNITPPGAPAYGRISPNISQENSPNIQWLIIFISVNISFIVYTIFIVIRLYRHNQNINNYFSSKPAKITLHWLRLSTIAFLGTNIFIGILIFLSPQSSIINPGIAESYGLILFIFVFSIFSNNQSWVFSEEITHSQAGKNASAPDNKKYTRSGLKENDVGDLLSAIEEYMEQEKPYLDSELTIFDLSKTLGIKRHYITQIINEHYKVNFCAYINNWRINYIKDKLKSERYSDATLLQLSIEAGFNSKATFNRAFKTFTGMTPSEFKNQQNL